MHARKSPRSSGLFRRASPTPLLEVVIHFRPGRRQEVAFARSRCRWRTATTCWPRPGRTRRCCGSPGSRALVAMSRTRCWLVGVLRQVFHEAAVELDEAPGRSATAAGTNPGRRRTVPARRGSHSCATAPANSCAARRCVNTLASGNCSTRCSPLTPCAASCSPMKRARLSSASEACDDLHQQRGRLACAACARPMTSIAWPTTQRSISHSRPCSSAIGRKLRGGTISPEPASSRM